MAKYAPEIAEDTGRRYSGSGRQGPWPDEVRRILGGLETRLQRFHGFLSLGFSARVIEPRL
jgi:hypothetical protein